MLIVTTINDFFFLSGKHYFCVNVDNCGFWNDFFCFILNVYFNWVSELILHCAFVYLCLFSACIKSKWKMIIFNYLLLAGPVLLVIEL